MDGHDFITKYINVHFNKFVHANKDTNTILEKYRRTVLESVDIVDINNLPKLVDIFYNYMKEFLPLEAPNELTKEFNSLCIDLAKLYKQKKFVVRIILFKEKKFWIRNEIELFDPINSKKVRGLEHGVSEITLLPGVYYLKVTKRSWLFFTKIEIACLPIFSDREINLEW